MRRTISDDVPRFAPTPLKGGDLCSKNGAEELARMIKRKWAKLGYDVAVTVEPVSCRSDSGRAVYAVRSDMIGGVPRTRLNKAAA